MGIHTLQTATELATLDTSAAGIASPVLVVATTQPAMAGYKDYQYPNGCSAYLQWWEANGKRAGSGHRHPHTRPASIRNTEVRAKSWRQVINTMEDGKGQREYDGYDSAIGKPEATGEKWCRNGYFSSYPYGRICLLREFGTSGAMWL